MKAQTYFLIVLVSILSVFISCDSKPSYPLADHPNSNSWQALFSDDLSNAIYPDGIWFVENGELTATEDQNIWAQKDYDNFVLDLEFKNADGTNSGVVVYCSDVENWIPNSVEIQIADDYNEKWAASVKNWQCGAFFGRKAATKSMVKKPGEWNRFTITCIDNKMYVILNGEQINEIDLTKYTDATVNPDGSPAPEWLSKPLAEMATKGKIGLQGKHAGAPIYFRNIRIMEIQ